MLVAMNPASLKANLQWVALGGTIIVNVDAFVDKDLIKRLCSNPLEDGSLSSYHIIQAPISSQAKEIAISLGMDIKDADRTKNMYALGIVAFIYDRDLKILFKQINDKFKKSPKVAEINIEVLKAGYIYAESIEAIESRFHIPTAVLPKGKYRNISGNIATAWVY